jgi:hypothetical protein
MTRRKLFALALPVSGAGATREARVPTDVDALNAFANQYNYYTAAIREGVVDLKTWERVRRAWRRLTGEGAE